MDVAYIARYRQRVTVTEAATVSSLLSKRLSPVTGHTKSCKNHASIICFIIVVVVVDIDHPTSTKLHIPISCQHHAKAELKTCQHHALNLIRRVFFPSCT